MSENYVWGTDTPISEPVPPTAAEQAALIPMGGFGFGPNGLTHDLSSAEAEVLFQPFFAPDAFDQRKQALPGTP